MRKLRPREGKDLPGSSPGNEAVQTGPLLETGGAQRETAQGQRGVQEGRRAENKAAQREVR